MRLFFLVTIAIALLSSSLIAQSRTDLEGERKSLNQEINQANQKLSKTATEKKTVLQNLSNLQKQLSLREQLVAGLTQNVDTLNILIDQKISIVESMETDLDKLKENYKKIVRVLYRYKVKHNLITFLFSAKNFNEAYQRWVYLQHLEKKRSIQAKLIKQVQIDLSKRINILENQKSEKDTLLRQELGQKELLNQELITKDKRAKQLKKQENELLNNLKRKQRYKNQLNKKIEEAIQKQILAAKNTARQYQSASIPKAKENNKNTDSKDKTTPILKAINPANASNYAFSQQKGKLALPVYQGKIIEHYGMHSHSKFQDVVSENRGIDISGFYNSVAISVYEGEVVAIFTIPGMNNAVMVKHGDYYTTYSNIAQVYVKKGDKIKTNGQIGTIARDAQAGGYMMHFELWHNKTKQNPSDWIRR